MTIHSNEKRFSPHRDLHFDFDDEIMNEDDVHSAGDFQRMNNDGLNEYENDEDEPPPPAPLSPDSQSLEDTNNNSLANSPDGRNGPGNKVNTTFDTLDDFGEDTLHALMDNELRLGTVPPLSSGWVLPAHDDVDDGGMLDGDVRSEHEEKYEFDSRGNVMKDQELRQQVQQEEHEKINGQFNVSFDELNDHDSFDDHSASESLLRGPLMAARSFASMHPPATMSNTAAIMTPSTARAQFVTSTMKDLGGRRGDNCNDLLVPEGQMPDLPVQQQLHHQQQQELQQPHVQSNTSSNSVKSARSQQQQPNETPSTARSTMQSKNGIMSNMTNNIMKQRHTPSNLIISTQKPPLSHSRTTNGDNIHTGMSTRGNNGNMTPSTVRNGFLTSPQDSISTIGSIQSGVHHTRVIDVKEGMTPSQVRGGFMSPGNGGGGAFSFDPDNVCNNDVQSGNDYKEEHTPMDHSANSNNNNNNISVKHVVKSTPQSTDSIQHLLALGEEQMKQQLPAKASNIIATTTPGNIVKKSFLKKGTRKEPSALHTTQFNAKTATALTCNNKSTPQDESASERKARLAKLEKMQEDLRKDYERRERRKEEAKRERRKMRRDGGKGVVGKGMVERLVSGAEQNSGDATPSTARSQSAVKARMQDGMTPSAARAKSAVKARVDDGVTPSAARANSAIKSTVKKSNSKTNGNNTNPTPSQVRLQSPVVDEYDNDRSTTMAEVDMQLNADDASLKNNNDSAVKVAPTQAKPAVRTSAKQNKKAPISRRSRSLSRPKTTQSKPTIGSLSPKPGTKDTTSNEKAFEDWKKKETEEWALIKNMRRRQEAALREAEGERERVSF